MLILRKRPVVVVVTIKHGVGVKHIIVVVAELTIDNDFVIACDTKHRVVVVFTATVTAERFVKPDFNRKPDGTKYNKEKAGS